MRIKYTSCDGITEIEEEIESAMQYQRDDKYYLDCTRSESSEFLYCGKSFVVATNNVAYIKVM